MGDGNGDGDENEGDDVGEGNEGDGDGNGNEGGGSKRDKKESDGKGDVNMNIDVRRQSNISFMNPILPTDICETSTPSTEARRVITSTRTVCHDRTTPRGQTTHRPYIHRSELREGRMATDCA